MTNKVEGMNPNVLKWVRERSGVTIDNVANLFSKDPEIIKKWEAGTDIPTYGQLEKMANLYKRPIALFFFPEPPEEIEFTKSFRTLPQNEIEILSSNTRFLLRQAKAMQLSLYELMGEKNTISKLIFRKININENDDIKKSAKLIRENLGITLNDQIDWRDKREALKNWREAVQGAGIFVFKDSFKQKEISGFCLLDDEFPIIYLNNSTSDTRQIFTIFHELAHILLGINGITKNDDSYIQNLTSRYKKIEIFCNALSAEFLVPSDDFASFISYDFYDDKIVNKLSTRYKVRQEVILRKALEFNCIDQNFYNKKANEFSKYFKKNTKGEGGNYYLNKITYLGNKFINLAFSRFYQGNITKEQLADYLNVKVANIVHIEPLIIDRTNI